MRRMLFVERGGGDVECTCPSTACDGFRRCCGKSVDLSGSCSGD